uniref:Trafficking protein particle complex subunit 9 n=1 Tax=Caenorhabditis tropicalis TaxID=1561998 RepID=A0A1I7T982_9PELO
MKSSTSDFLTDVQTVNIVIKQIGPNKSLPAFKRIVERCSRQRVIQVSDNPRRLFHCSFTQSSSYTEFSELQQHRRVFAVIGVAFTNGHGEPDKSTRASRESTDSEVSEAEQISIAYNKLKSDYSNIICGRCILIGGKDEDFNEVERHERLCYGSLEDATQLESAIRELMRAIYIVIEMKRVDVSFEKKQDISCPSLPDESRWQVGVETKSTKSYKKKCIGRYRKQHADYCLLTGLPQLALEAYEGAIESLKSAQDHLWLAAAYDGWASTVCILHAEQMGEINSGAFHRVASMHAMFTIPSIEINTQSGDSLSVSNDSVLSSPQGHKRHHSDEHVRITSSMSNGLERNESFGNESGIVSNGSSPSIRDEPAKIRASKGLNPLSNFLSDRREKPTKERVMENFKNAIEEFSKFTMAGWLEYETVMRAIMYLILEREYIKLEQFHRDHTGKYLDDTNTFMDHRMKAQICLNSAAMYKEIGFLRKQAFYARLSVLFELHVTEGRVRQSSDYKTVYPVLFRTLEGYGVDLSEPHDLKNKKLGPVKLQIKSLHEIFTAANRAGHRDAAIRHLCFLLQVYYPHLDSSMTVRLFDDLDNLVKATNSVHQLNTTIVVDDGKIIIPGLQLTRFPIIQTPTVLALQPNLAPTIVPNKSQASIFIYTPFAKKADNALLWVTDCPGEVEVTVRNCRGTELIVRDLCLIVEGVNFEPVQARLILPPEDEENNSGSTIRLLGVPREPGDLFITGYSCNIFGLHNECRFYSSNCQKPNKIRVKVLPKLARVYLECSLPRAPIEEENDEPSAEAVVYSGQKFDHTITVVNSSDIPVRYCGVKIWQPVVQGGPPLIRLDDSETHAPELEAFDTADDLSSFILEPNGSKELKFHIFGIDPTSTADDLSDEEKVLESVVPLANTQSIPNPEAEPNDMDLIPFTGRLLTADFIVRYHSDITSDDGHSFERKCKLPIAISIIPAVTVSAWHVLPGDSPFSRYIVVDVTNSTEHDAELVYSNSRRMYVLPKETCRVPILSPCCSDVTGGAFHQAKQRGSHMMQKMETERLRLILENHVSKHLDIRWAIPALNLDGQVPVGSLLSSVSLLKQLVLPAISLDFFVNGKQYVSEDDVAVGIGQFVTVEVSIISSLAAEYNGLLSLECEQEISHLLGSNDTSNFMLVTGLKKVPFTVDKENKQSASFDITFIVEGSFRVRPQITPAPGQNALLAEDMFATPVAFSVTTKF